MLNETVTSINTHHYDSKVKRTKRCRIIMIIVVVARIWVLRRKKVGKCNGVSQLNVNNDDVDYHYEKHSMTADFW